MTLAAPFGTFLTQFDSAITTAQTAAVSGLATAMQAPLASMAVIYFAFMGWRVARGDLQLVHDFTVHMAKIGFIFYLATNLTAYNKWVIGLWQQGIPAAIAQAVTGAGRSTATSSVNGVAASLDQVWDQMWQMAAHAWAQAGYLDVSTRVVAAISVFGGGGGLLLCAGVYLISRFLFAVVVVLGPVAIGCAMFSSTRPIFERWIGKGVSMIVLQAAAIITLQIVIAGDQQFMTSLNTAAAPDLPTQLQNLIAMMFWLCMGAFAIYSLPALAYSIGTGVAISMVPVAGAAFLAARAGGGLASGAMGAVSSVLGGGGGGSGPFPDLNLSLSRAELPTAGGGDASMVPSPPAALPYASVPLLTYEG